MANNFFYGLLYLATRHITFLFLLKIMLPWSDCVKTDQSGIILFLTKYVYTQFFVSVFNSDNASLLF